MSDSEKASLLRNEAMTPLTGFFNLGPMEMIILLVVGVMIFGRRLPEVGRYLGKGIVEFKKGIKDLFVLLKNMIGDEVINSQPMQPGGFAKRLRGLLRIKPEQFVFRYT